MMLRYTDNQESPYEFISQFYTHTYRTVHIVANRSPTTKYLHDGVGFRQQDKTELIQSWNRGTFQKFKLK